MISIKLQSNFTEITLRHVCSPINLVHIFRTPFLRTTLGGCIWSIKIVNMPIVIGSKRILFEIDAVKNNIPLLISKGEMSKWGMKIDFTRHEVELHGQVIKLQCNSS